MTTQHRGSTHVYKVETIADLSRESFSHGNEQLRLTSCNLLRVVSLREHIVSRKAMPRYSPAYQRFSLPPTF